MTSHLHRSIIGLTALTLVIAGCAGSSDVAETAVEAESSTTVTVVETTVPTTPSTFPERRAQKLNQVNYGRLSRRKHLRYHKAILLPLSRIPQRHFVQTPQPNSSNA